jgi:hypothetical protein
MLDLHDPLLTTQAAAAGFASAEQYLQSLIEQDADRLAILEGLESAQSGCVRPFEEFDREFRQRHGLPARS